jgi:4-aminobutyrate aminotransferase-like enzyme/Ser/Thr protein kinase RdoA (MazF antagonist)
MTLLQHTPTYTGSDAISIVKHLYAIRATASPLPSERDQNFLMTAETGDRFVLKIANALENRTMLDAQNQVMQHLGRHVEFCPRILATKAGELISKIQSAEGKTYFARLVSYLPGIPLANAGYHSPALLTDLGRRLGRMDRAMADFDHPGAHRDFHWDLANALQVVREHQALIRDPSLREKIEKCADAFERNVIPLFPRLRKSVIHNDANDYNVIVGGGNDPYTRNQGVVGIIDFGDMVYSYTVGNLAIAAAYAVLDKPDSLKAAALVTAGYHAEYPLEEEEIAVLFDLLRMRLCVSVCLAGHQLDQQPDNEYLAVSQTPIRKALPRLADIHARFAEAVFREACGMPPVPRSEPVRRWLEKHGQDMASVLDMDLRTEPLAVFDMSIGSPLMNGDPRENEEPALSGRLSQIMKAAEVTVGVGRYNEARMFYTIPPFGPGDVSVEAHRTAHMGMDVFTEAGSTVHAPLEGTVSAFARNDAPLDYGPVIILEHRTDKGDRFHTLYGHLSPDSLEGLYPGKTFAKGEPIGLVGLADTNGGWTPHLHFQIIIDLLELGTEFPGVVRAAERRVWTALCPDPNLILGIPADRFPPPEPTKAQTFAARRKYMGRNLSIGYRDPVKIVRGWKQYLFDETGRRYLDAYNNVPHVGHCHPRVVEAACRQMTVLNTNTRYLNDFMNRYAERLCGTMPDPLSVCFFINSASEGNELALRLARSYTGHRDMIVLEGAYHGHTTSLIDISPYKHDGPGGTGAPSWVHTAAVADVFRGPYKADDPGAGTKYARQVSEIITMLQEKGIGLAGFIAESCPSVGGQIFFPEGYLSAAYRHVREAGGICIADEVQTGYGRIGTHFYAFETQGVVPDIVVLGKPIGNGHPISAVVTTPEIANAFDNGMEFFSTFGGNTVSCAVGLTVLDVVQEENLQANALQCGRRMLDGIAPFVARYPIVGDVRGSGLFLGVELVRDRETLEPADVEASWVVNRMREHGILMGTDGPFHNVLKIRPPMPFNEDNADLLVATLDRILAEGFGG